MNELMIADLITSAKLLAIGWGGIFIVMIVLYIVIKLLLKVFPLKRDN